ncbi:hypothetical protein HXX01_01490 [Candidatus Nomurabacteria bacterium]|nr:hypothetical protein [Candidatus Nomurabacteria bacterium]
MKDKINKVFHTETLLGKIILLISFYVLFWFLAYGFWNIGSLYSGFKNLFSSDFSIFVLFKGLLSLLTIIFKNFSVGSFAMLVILLYFLIFIPIMSFYLLKRYIIPCLNTKKVNLIYILNSLFLIFSIWYFVVSVISSISFEIW